MGPLLRNRPVRIIAVFLALVLTGAVQWTMHRGDSLEPPKWRAARQLQAGDALQPDDLVAPPMWAFRGSLPLKKNLEGRFLRTALKPGDSVSPSDTSVLPSPDATSGLLVYDLTNVTLRRALETGIWVRGCIRAADSKAISCLAPAEVVAVTRNPDGTAAWVGLRVGLADVDQW